MQTPPVRSICNKKNNNEQRSRKSRRIRHWSTRKNLNRQRRSEEKKDKTPIPALRLLSRIGASIKLLTEQNSPMVSNWEISFQSSKAMGLEKIIITEISRFGSAWGSDRNAKAVAWIICGSDYLRKSVKQFSRRLVISAGGIFRKM